MLFITRREDFCASHRLHNPDFTDEQNRELYGKCNHVNGHGHNYVLEVTVAGDVPPETGMVLDLKVLKTVIRERIIHDVDHRHLNHDVDFLEGVNPTAENLAVAFWNRLEGHLPQGRLYRVRVYETANNVVDYFGPAPRSIDVTPL